MGVTENVPYRVESCRIVVISFPNLLLYIIIVLRTFVSENVREGVMSKIERIKGLQKMLAKITSAMMELDHELSSMKEIISKNEFIPEDLNCSVCGKLALIGNFQAIFSETYNDLGFGEMPPQIHSAENLLSENLDRLEEEDVYTAAFAFFELLTSKEPEIEKLLKKHQALMRESYVPGMPFEQLKEIAERYVLFRNVYLEEDPKKRMSLAFKLAPWFEDELLVGLNFGTLECLPKEETEGGETGKGEEFDFSEEDIIAKAVDEAEQVAPVKNDADSDEDASLRLVSELCAQWNGDSLKKEREEIQREFTGTVEGRFVKECPEIFHVEYGNLSKSKFSVKEFKREIGKQYAREKIFCLGEAMLAAVSPETAALKKHASVEVYGEACEKLFHMGYFKKFF